MPTQQELKAVPDRPPPDLRHGVTNNLPQFLLLLVVNAFVGATIGVERSTLATLGTDVFLLTSATVATSFIVAFGITKACTNLFAGRLADTLGRRRVLLIGWLFALPVPLLIMWAPNWGWVVAANVFLGLNQGLCWTLTLLMKIDLGGKKRRGFSAGINETVGYGAVALAAFVGVELAARYNLQTAPFVFMLVVALIGLAVTMFFVKNTQRHVDHEHIEETSGEAKPTWKSVFAKVSFRDKGLFGYLQAGFARNLADGMAWGLLILMFKEALDARQAGQLTAIMIGAFAVGQLIFGSASDRYGRKGFVVAGMIVIAASLAMIAATEGFTAWAVGSLALGVGGSLMYPTAIAGLSDRMAPIWRATGLGVYRFWRDMGYAVGALSSALIADKFGMEAAVYSVAGVCLVSGIVAAVLLPSRTVST
ncbi:MAG: MFS transporter [Armatimonadetes bacterium]|nr:MFS transporter [Armatimonadota bacterium]